MIKVQKLWRRVLEKKSCDRGYVSDPERLEWKYRVYQCKEAFQCSVITFPFGQAR